MKNFRTKPTGYCQSEHAGALIGETVNSCRRKMGISRANLAIMSGISISQISRLEKGIGTPSLLAYIKVSKALEINLSEIISEVESNLQD